MRYNRVFGKWSSHNWNRDELSFTSLSICKTATLAFSLRGNWPWLKLNSTVELVDVMVIGANASSYRCSNSQLTIHSKTTARTECPDARQKYDGRSERTKLDGDEAPTRDQTFTPPHHPLRGLELTKKRTLLNFIAGAAGGARDEGRERGKGVGWSEDCFHQCGYHIENGIRMGITGEW